MITIDIKSALIYLLLVAGIILIGYLIVVAKNLVTTIKELNKILEDTSVITNVAAERSVEVNGMIDDIQSAVADVSQAVKGEVGVIGSFANVTKAVLSLKELFHTKKNNTKKKSINKY